MDHLPSETTHSEWLHGSTQEFYGKSSAECKLLDVVIVNLAVSLFCIALSGDCEDICRNFERGITETESSMSSDSRRQLRRRR